MRPEILCEDRCYFLLTYHDKELRLPEITTYIYVGKNIFDSGGSENDPRWFFQTAESRVSDGLFDPKVHEPAETLLAVEQDMLDEFCDLGKLIDTLRDIEARSGNRR